MDLTDPQGQGLGFKHKFKDCFRKVITLHAPLLCKMRLETAMLILFKFQQPFLFIYFKIIELQ